MKGSSNLLARHKFVKNLTNPVVFLIDSSFVFLFIVSKTRTILLFAVMILNSTYACDPLNIKWRFPWRFVLVKINIIQQRYKSLFWPVQQLLWGRWVFLSSLLSPFVSVFSIDSINFSFVPRITCFSGTANYFWYKYWELFFHCAGNYFSRYRDFIFWPTILRDCDWGELARVFSSSVWLPWRPFWRLCNRRGRVLSKRMPRRNIVWERNERGFDLF